MPAGKLGISDSQLGNILYGGSGIPVINASTYNTFSLTQSVIVNLLHLQTPLSTLTLNQQANYIFLGQTGVLNTLTLTQTVEAWLEVQRLFQNLTFIQTLGAGAIFNKSITDNFNLVHASSAVKIHPIIQTITFTNSADVEVVKWSNNTLALTQSATFNWNHRDSVSQVFDISQQLNNDTVFTRSLTNTITLISTVTSVKAKYRSVSNTFLPFYTLIITKLFNLRQTLNLTQTVNSYRVLSISTGNNIIFNQTLNRNVIYNLALQDNLIYLYGFNKELEDLREAGGADDEIGLQSLEDENEPAPFWAATYWIPAARATFVTRAVSLATKTQVVTLKRPLLGDSESPINSIITQRTINAKIYTYVQKSSLRTLKYKFELPKNKTLELRGFLLKNLSTPIELTNWKGEVWYGYLNNNPFNMESYSSSGECDMFECWNIDIEFTGVRVH